ncbi:hypothetical protein IQ07DRAFT_313663 [Pyrenochaeta sp. DS3sAY3a]|nr:hypothetical protein IQ07DRAFT_313663 [Pyrenochaeta sp. DS3sAY3a]
MYQHIRNPPALITAKPWLYDSHSINIRYHLFVNIPLCFVCAMYHVRSQKRRAMRPTRANRTCTIKHAPYIALAYYLYPPALIRALPSRLHRGIYKAPHLTGRTSAPRAPGSHRPRILIGAAAGYMDGTLHAWTTATHRTRSGTMWYGVHGFGHRDPPDTCMR